MKKNKYSTPLWMLATILAGMLSPMQSAVNGQLGHPNRMTMMTKHGYCSMP